jgi:hypothetical protein
MEVVVVEDGPPTNACSLEYMTLLAWYVNTGDVVQAIILKVREIVLSVYRGAEQAVLICRAVLRWAGWRSRLSDQATTKHEHN